MAYTSHRDRVVMALNHEEADRVPRDLAQGPATGINATAYSRLVDHIGIGEETTHLTVDRRGLTATPSETVLERFDIDFRSLAPGTPDAGPDEDVDEDSFRDEWGVMWARPQGGHFITRTGPFQQRELTSAEMSRYRWPVPRDPGRIRGLREQALRLRTTTDYAIVLRLPYAIVRECQRVRGFGEWLEDLLLLPILAEELMEHCLDVSAGIAEYVLQEVGDLVDVVSFPDDMGFQDRPYVRPELYREMIKPYHRRLVEAIKSNTEAKVVMHSDGSVYPIIPDFIEIGVDALNPVQVSAKDMDSQRLKAEFGEDMCFWGGIDTHRVLPTGTPEAVRGEVKTRIADLAPGGGYVLASVHNIQAEVPPENIVAMFDSAEEYGQYPVSTRD
jgi:uroporphyrinogen decarboxylase